MKNRCSNPNQACYVWYGARGIRVCDEWQGYAAFRAWAISNGFRKGLSLERIDNDKGYSPDNCCWIPLSEQWMNKRPCAPATHCKHGHPFTPENLYMTRGGRRACKICSRERQTTYYARKKELNAAAGMIGLAK